MLKSILTTFFAATVALSIFSAAPAHAGQKDAVKVIAGLTALTILYSALNKQGHAPKATVTRDYTVKPHNIAPRHHGARPLPTRARKKILPRHCLRTIQRRHGEKQVFSARCLQRTLRHTERLPRQCRIKNRNGHRRAYDPYCLRGYGYRTSRR